MKKIIVIEYEKGETHCKTCPLRDRGNMACRFVGEFGLDCTKVNMKSLSVKDE